MDRGTRAWAIVFGRAGIYILCTAARVFGSNLDRNDSTGGIADGNGDASRAGKMPLVIFPICTF
jgi:hypothetical protein